MTDDLTHTDKELNHCPACKSDDIRYDGHFESGSQKVSCDACEATWFEVWTYAGIFYADKVNHED